jgi:hypothetical protein
VCKSVQPRIYGVSKREPVNVICEVEANPPDVKFRWTFNNSAEMIRVPKVRKYLFTEMIRVPKARKHLFTEMIRVPQVKKYILTRGRAPLIT